MKRREFIKYSGIVFGSSSLLSACTDSNSFSQKRSLKSFIVSDAHIGWRGKDQPTIEKQSVAVRNIINRFKDLDLAFDTGDIHHGYLNEKARVKARTQWLNHIANSFSNVPFHYIPGNHELGKAFMDPEIIACSFGSIPHRPYYAFDYMGIHFVSLPELQSTILVSKETINWLKLDLQLNEEKTTIILSHNSLKGTTYDNNETGYRGLTNSDELAHIFNQNSQVKAWFHGHQHHYEIVKFKEVLYVSNGRIGGFNPPKKWGEFGQGHLGGIFFEIDSKGITVKAYSATEGKFLDQLGYPKLSMRLKTETSFDPYQSFNFYSGNGNALDRVPQTISQHYVSSQDPLLVYVDSDSVINDNSELSYETKYFFANKHIEKIIGYKINNNKIFFESNEKGLAISNPKSIESFSMSFPTQKHRKNRLFKRGSYFRSHWNQPYQLIVDLETTELQVENISLEAKLFDERYNFVKTKLEVVKKTNKSQITFDINTGKKTSEVDRVYLFFKLFFENCDNDIQINKIQLMPLPIKTHNTASAYLEFNGEKKPLITAKTAQLIEIKQKMKILNFLSFKGKENPTTCFILKQPAVEWQIRNGTGYFANQHTLCVNPQSHNFNAQVETIITPTVPKSLYINKCTINNPINITFINDRHIKVHTSIKSNYSNLTIVSAKPLKQIIGAKLVSEELNTYLCKPTSNVVEIFS